MRMQEEKEIFIQFLKDNEFYDGWMEGYNLDNEIYQDNVPLDDFFENCPPKLWLYNGMSSLAFLPNKEALTNDNQEIIRKWEDWRKRYSSLYMELDEKWMNYYDTKQTNI